MFGLMRPEKSCSQQHEHSTYHHHRQHYCGTCKAIGQQYGHKSRLLLNFDSVFLAELMSDLYKTNTKDWETALQSTNTCFTMPEASTLPFELAYPATASVLLGTLKIDDQIKDKQQFSWKVAKRFYSSAFRNAIEQFQTWGIATDSIYNLVDQQIAREASSPCFEQLEDCLSYYAAPTVEITSFIFAQAGRNLSNNPAHLAHVGQLFGQLVYILDAFEDYEKDIFNQEFNPLAVFFDGNRSLNHHQLEAVRSILLSLQAELCTAFDLLPITDERKSIYRARLQSNIALRIYKERVIPQTFLERLQQRWDFAKSFATQVNCLPVRQLSYYVLVWAVFISPQTTEYLPQEGKLEMLQWTTLITAILGSLGIIGVIRKKSRKERRKEKRQRRRFRRFATKLKNILFRKDSCWSECCSDCCSGCCENFCDSVCESENPWFWVLIFLAGVLLAGLVLLILFLVGVI